MASYDSFTETEFSNTLKKRLQFQTKYNFIKKEYSGFLNQVIVSTDRCQVDKNFQPVDNVS